MSDSVVNGLAGYLTGNFPDCQIEQKHCLDLHAEAFKIHLPEDNLLLKLTAEFIDDTTEAMMAGAFGRSHIADLLRRHNQQVVFVTRDGPDFLTRT